MEFFLKSLECLIQGKDSSEKRFEVHAKPLVVFEHQKTAMEQIQRGVNDTQKKKIGESLWTNESLVQVGFIKFKNSSNLQFVHKCFADFFIVQRLVQSLSRPENVIENLTIFFKAFQGGKSLVNKFFEGALAQDQVSLSKFENFNQNELLELNVKFKFKNICLKRFKKSYHRIFEIAFMIMSEKVFYDFLQSNRVELRNMLKSMIIRQKSEGRIFETASRKVYGKREGQNLLISVESQRTIGIQRRQALKPFSKS
jgi:hypothetical protein